MHNQQILMAAIAGLASTAAARVNLPVVGALGGLRSGVVPRQAVDLGDECLNDIMEVLATVPQPPAELVEWSADQAEDLDLSNPSELAQLCTPAADVPASLTSASAAYETTLVAWLSQESSAVASLLSSCSTNEYVQSAASLVDQVTQDPACSSVLASATASLGGLLPSGTPAATGSGSDAATPAATGSGSDAATPAATGSGSGSGAPQETGAVPAAAGHNGVVASVLVGAGFLGLVALL